MAKNINFNFTRNLSIFQFVSSIAILTIFCYSLYWLYVQYRHYVREIEIMEKVYIEQTRSRAKDFAAHAIRYIEEREYEAFKGGKSDFERRISCAYRVLQQIDSTAMDSTLEQKKQLLINLVAHAILPTLHQDVTIFEEGKLIYRKMNSGISIERYQELCSAYRSGEKESKKVLQHSQREDRFYIDHFEAWGLTMILGERYSSYLEKTKQSVLDEFSRMRFGDSGHLFVFSTDAIALMNPFQKAKDGVNILEDEDLSGRPIVQEMMALSKQPKGGFVQYRSLEPRYGRETDKIAYIVSYPEWGWVIGAGVYLEKMNTAITGKKEQLKRDFTVHLASVFFVALGLSLVVVFFLRWWKKQADEAFKSFADHCRRVKNEHQYIELHDLRFREFSELAEAFNDMLMTREKDLEQIQESHHKLQILYKKLENQNRFEVLEKNRAIKENEKQNAFMLHQARLASIGEMMSNIAHQWRQPINALSLITFNFLTRVRKGEWEAHIDTFSDEHDRIIMQMSQTIDDFRNFFKPNRKKTVFKLSGQIEEAIKMSKPMLDHHGIVIELHKEEDLEIKGYPSEFTQVVINLINNSRDEFIKKKKEIKHKKITIKITRDNESCLIFIHDNAGGIPESLLPNIFDPYFTTKADKHGTGIGLYMSKMIVEKNMKGTLQAHNEAGGAMFVMTFKIREEKNHES